tara:strand:+ start:3635 stop:4306 length:672 start_codon:yes stop_codon:yes gene_type:complete
VIDTVLFDFVNTIAYSSPRREDILYDFIANINAPFVDKNRIIHAFKKIDDLKPYSSVNIQSPHEKKEFYSSYNKMLLAELGIVSKKDFYDYYKNIQRKWILDDKCVSVLTSLKKRGRRIGVISNFDRNLRGIINDLGIIEFIDFLVISQEIGLEKPNIEFYKYVQSCYNIDITKTIYVGDSYSLDYLPARKIGIKSYLIDKSKYYTNVQGTIDCLSKILYDVT